jgi:hypothetical protein
MGQKYRKKGDVLKSTQILRELHPKKNYGKNFSYIISILRSTVDEQTYKKALRFLYQFELELHKNNWIECEDCIKFHIGTNETSKELFDAKYPGISDKLPQYVKGSLHDLGSNVKWTKLMATKEIMAYYLDFAKDILLLVAILLATSSLSITSFSSQIALLYSAIICIPLIINSGHGLVIKKEALIGLPDKNLRIVPRFLSKIFLIISIPFIPGILIYRIKDFESKITVTNKIVIEKTRSDSEEGIGETMKHIETVKSLMMERNELEKVLTTFMKTETFEVLFQGVISVILLSMNYYKFSLTNNGLQSFFVELDWYVPISLFLTMKKNVTVTIKGLQSQNDGFLAIKGKIIFGIYSAIGALVRGFAIVMYFSVSLGLWNLLSHWKYETLDIDWRKYEYKDESLFTDSDYEPDGRNWINLKIKERELDLSNPIKFAVYNEVQQNYDLIYIKNISDQLITKAPYSKYSGLTLGWSYALFLAGVVIHICIVILKEYKNKETVFEKESKQKWIVIIANSFSSLVLPQVSVQWDVGPLSVKTIGSKNIIAVIPCIKI